MLIYITDKTQENVCNRYLRHHMFTVDRLGYKRVLFALIFTKFVNI